MYIATECGFPAGCEYTRELEVMILLHKDETCDRRSFPVLQGVSAALSDDPIDASAFLGSCDTPEEADLAASRSNLRRTMAQSMAGKQR